MLRRLGGRGLDAGSVNALMGAIRLSNTDKLVIGLVGTAVCSQMVRSSATRLGWTPIAVGSALYIASRAAKLL